MSFPAVRDAILEALEGLRPGDSMATDAVVQAVQSRWREANRKPPADRAIRGRLTTLVQEGVVERQKRGSHSLARHDEEPSQSLQDVLGPILDRWTPQALQRMVAWDATPVLDRSEDGAPGIRIVLEHPDIGQLRPILERTAVNGREPLVWRTRSAGPLGEVLWEPDEPAPTRIDVGIILVEKERIAGTGLTQAGYRTPTTERKTLEFLALDAPAQESRDILASLLYYPASPNITRLWQAANGLNVLPDLLGLLSAVYRRLGPVQRQEYRGKLPNATQRFLEGSS